MKSGKIVEIVLACCILAGIIIVGFLLIHNPTPEEAKEPPVATKPTKTTELATVIKSEWEPHGAEILLANTERSCFVLSAPYFPLGNDIPLRRSPQGKLFAFPEDTPPVSFQHPLLSEDGITVVNGVKWTTCDAADPPSTEQYFPNPYYNPRVPTTCLVKLELWEHGGKLHFSSKHASLRTIEECVEPERLQEEEYEPSEVVTAFANHVVKMPIKLDNTPIALNAPYLISGMVPMKVGSVISMGVDGRSSGIIGIILIFVLGFVIGLRWDYIHEFLFRIKSAIQSAIRDRPKASS